MNEEKLRQASTLFEVFPISLQKHAFTRNDFRFGCLLPNVSLEGRRCLLDTNQNECLLLYDPENKLVVGKQYKDGGRIWFYEDISFNTESVIHFSLKIQRIEGNIIATIFDYVQENDMLEEFFQIINIIARCALKLGYKEEKKAIFETVKITWEGEPNTWKLNTNIYDNFDK